VTSHQDRTAADNNCYACRNTQSPSLPPRERVAHTDHWRVAHAFDTDLPGWLVLLPTRHITSIADLDPEAAAELGPLLHQLSVALRDEVGCLKTYVMQFSEAEGYTHVHFHLVPRMTDQPVDHRGPRVFAHLGHADPDRVSKSDQDALALRLRARLDAPAAALTADATPR
jgi:diadenosine tetraphosphate (Ap4A) HIT family hydrolase